MMWKTAALVCILATSSLVRADDADIVKFRQLTMKELDAEATALGMIAAGQIPADTLAANLEAIAVSAQIAQKAFEPKVPGGRVKPNAWSNWDDFSKRMQVFVEKTQAMAKAGKAHGKPDGSCRFAFPEWCRIDGGHEYIPAEWCSMKPLKYVKRNLRLQLSVRK